ncbi:MAG TPA: hypothetical protein PLO67_01900 [Saprospiraceae bacterium]|nr:hypothetical protein [Saprospiraceae bacterium]
MERLKKDLPGFSLGSSLFFLLHNNKSQGQRVILSIAKDLVTPMFGEKQILRYAQDDTLPLAFVYEIVEDALLAFGITNGQ